ncbi:hypothetical protein [Nocardia africana]|uniref:hypothetical protein n=1 Tax=Nocardia africana TaxID=134964 RepID=UPI0007A47BC9|nr:hypothetical protein [Nocardia africana]MCC3311503.1 hypothetical protein [Nocardia africana]
MNSDYDRLRAILLGDNPFLSLPWRVWDLPDNPLGPRVRLWDESFAPRWDSHPPTITPELSPEEWAAWHTRSHDLGLSAGRVNAIAATVAELTRTESRI